MFFPYAAYFEVPFCEVLVLYGNFLPLFFSFRTLRSGVVVTIWAHGNKLPVVDAMILYAVVFSVCVCLIILLLVVVLLSLFFVTMKMLKNG